MPLFDSPMQDPNSVQGVLQQLLSSYNPNERGQAQQNRQQAQQNLQSVMGMPLPDAGPVNRMVGDYLVKYAQNPAHAWNAMASAIGSEVGRTQDMQTNQLERLQQAAQSDYNQAEKQAQQADLYASKVLALGKGKGGVGSKVVKMDKDGNMVVYDPMSDETKVVHSSQRGEYQRIWSKAYEKAVSEGMEDPETYAHGVAADVLGSSPQTKPSVVPETSQPQNQQSRNVSLIETELARPENATNPERRRILEQELELERNKAGVPSVASIPAKPGSLAYKDKPEESRKTTFSTEMEKGAIKEYDESVKPAASSADSMLQTIGMIRQIPRTQDAFAPYRETLGSAMNALGLDGKMVREAQSLQQVRPLLAKIANDRLLMAKGVQTEGDAQRAYNEFAKITDTQKAADFMYAWSEELANRAKFREQVYRDSATTNGTMQKGRENWERTDYAKTAPVAILNGTPWTYTKWRDAFLKANKDANIRDAIAEWNKLSSGSK